MYRAVAQLLPTLRAWSRAPSRPDERGQTLVEYGLLLFFIAIVVIAVLIVLGPTVSGIFRSVNEQL